MSRHAIAFLALWAAMALAGGVLKLGMLAYSSPQAIVAGSFNHYFAPYVVIAVAPALGWLLASRAYPHNAARRQPEVRMARFGSWRQLAPHKARRESDYGLAGFLVSLSAGLLLSMVLRLGQFAVAMPIVPDGSPDWAITLYQLMIADLAVLSFMYFVCFTMALRRAPLFPRMLLLTWFYDIISQMLIIDRMSANPAVPSSVLAPLQQLLGDNIEKVLISMAIWVPYLIFSKRVNLTFRHRVKQD